MLYGFLGYKIGMTQIFDQEKNLIPVSLIKVESSHIISIKTISSDGYNAIQIGCGNNQKKLTKPEAGVFLKKNISPFQYLKEFKVINTNEYSLGMKYDIDIFKINNQVTISGLTIGKGNTGNIKKHNFNRGPMSHGSKHHRLQGSIGAGTTPGRTLPGKKMPGRLGNTQITIKNLKIIDIDYKNELLIVKGSLPGKFKNLLSLTYLN